MLSVGVRDEEGQVHSADGGIFDGINDPSDGSVNYDDVEYHVVFHDAAGPLTSNYPPPFQFFYHLTFENVKVGISQGD